MVGADTAGAVAAVAVAVAVAAAEDDVLPESVRNAARVEGNDTGTIEMEGRTINCDLNSSGPVVGSPPATGDTYFRIASGNM